MYLNIMPNITLSKVACIYTVEIRPPTPFSSCVAFKCGAAAGDTQKNVLVNAVSIKNIFN